MRLFVGIDLPGEIKDGLAALIELLRRGAPEAKWVPRDNLHLTIAFLGEVSEERVTAIEGALRAAATGKSAIDTALAGLGAFPSARRARVVWAGLDDAAGRMAALASDVSTALGPAGFEPEKRTWTAHLTLARLRTPADVSALLSERVAPASFAVSEITLFRSRLARPAPRYEAVGRFPLAP
jgi:RNA 2',3'-cyclic 3'-phosphodiesterase